MTFSVINHSVSPAFSSKVKEFTSNSFINTIDSHIQWLLGRSDNDIISVKANEVHKYNSDFYGLLKQVGVREEVWYPTLRMNGLNSPHEDLHKLHNIVVPSIAVIEDLLSRHKRKIK